VTDVERGGGLPLERRDLRAEDEAARVDDLADGGLQPRQEGVPLAR
jgi:hypothetical protein